jgi:hypothetical protein
MVTVVAWQTLLHGSSHQDPAHSDTELETTITTPEGNYE